MIRQRVRFGPLVVCRTALAFMAALSGSHAAVSLQPSRPGPWQVGGVVTWTASPSSGAVTDYWYRFRARRAGSPFRVWKDFGPANTFEWTAVDHPGTFEIEVTARDRATNDVSVASERYVM